MIVNLKHLRTDEEGVISRIDSPLAEINKLDRLGIRIGVPVRKISGFGPVVVAFGGTQVALGKKIAARVQVETRHFRALLFGNPNVGKSVVFSRLTGRQVISANYAGTTVDFARGYLRANGLRVEMVDVPGAYTLDATCTAEEIARDFCEKSEADLIVNVVDATNLERNLYLTLQLLEKGIPMIVALNKWDIARLRGIEIDTGELEKRLGVPVVPLVAITGQGLKELTSKIAQALNKKIPAPAFTPTSHEERWHIIGHISQEVQRIVHKHPSLLERLENASVRPISGTLLALAVLFLSFVLIRIIGEGLNQYLLNPFFERVYGPFIRHLVGSIPLPFLRELLIGSTPGFMGSFGALTTGIYLPIAIVLPYIFAFYLILGFLEDLGYLPRLAVLMDRIMHRLGLHGFAAIPLILGCGCKVPGVLGLRILESPREKFLALALMLMAAPCMPQSAMIVSLVSPFGAHYVLLIFIVLLAVALANNLILNHILKGESPEIILEIPPYQLPHLPTLSRKLWLRLKAFLLEAAPLIVLGMMALSLLQMTGAIAWLARAARPLVVDLMGLPPETVSVVLLGFLRKDVSIAMLSPMHLSAKQAVIASVFLVLYLPCLATFFVALREAGWRVALRLVGITLLWAIAVAGILQMVL